MRSLFVFIVLFSLTFAALGQSAIDFDHGNNTSYRPFTGFIAPVATPTPVHAPVDGPIANREKNLADKKVEGAHSGLHFAAGTEGVKTVRYDLYVSDTTVNYTGKQRHAIAVNGQVPAPTLVFTVGDTALIYVHNQADEPTSVHWHGVQLPNRMDGVPYLTQQPIPPHTTYIYKFPVVQAGTYWYHSHFSLQEQIGLFGALIFNKRTEPNIPTLPVVLSDWSNTKPREIERMLHTGNDWFGIKKHSVQSYWEALKAGKLGVKFTNEWKRMEAMDISDVYYERFFLGKDTAQIFSDFKAGDKVRLRLVNGGSSTYFWLSYSGGKITVVANDGNDVKPVDVDRLLIAPSETYDVVVRLPENKQYEFLATAEDRSGSASLWLGSGAKVAARRLGRLKYFAGMQMMNKMMKMNGDMRPMGMKMSLQTMDMNAVMYPEASDEKSAAADSPAMHPATHDHQTMVDTAAIYSCPMHPDVTSDRPGTCPKCGMQLVQAVSGKKPAANPHQHQQTLYSCPMHPDVTSDQPGTCPKCGMTLEKKTVPSHSHENPQSEVTLNYNMLRATHPTPLPEGSWKTLHFELTGNMNRYVWSLNNKTVAETDKIRIKRGENLRIVLYNNTMMRHPMHLHGHDFRLLNRYGKYAPMKNVVDIMPMETDTLEFHASESGDWFFHCHILYHMMSGMGRIFSYQDSEDNPEIPHRTMADKMLKMDHNMVHLTAQNDFATNGNDGSVVLANARWAFQGEWRLGYNAADGYEVETHFGRYFGPKQWLFPYAGIDWRYRRHAHEGKSLFGQKSTKDDRLVFHVGVQYTLPWLIIADASMDHTGYVRLQLKREDIPLSPRLRAAFMVNTDREYMLGGRYIMTKNFSLSTHYDSDMGWGMGVTITY